MSISDHALASWYFDHYIHPVVVTPDVPPDGVAIMRRQYISGAIENPEAMDEIRHAYTETKRGAQ